jgi:plastocyanin
MPRWNVRALLLGLLLLGLAAGTLAPAGRHATPVAHAADVWNVQVGGDAAGLPATAISFFPSVLDVHVGDTVVWNFVPAQDPHTVSFLAKQPPPEGFIPGPNGEIDFGPAAAPFGPVGPAATYDGTVPVSSGIPAEEDATFRLTFTATGFFDYLCLVHGPSMSGLVRVAGAGATLPETPNQARQRGLADFHSLTEQATEGGPPPGPPPAAGGLATQPAVVPVAAGASIIGGFVGNLAGLLFIPDTVTVRRGDTVVWTVVDPLEIHTVTFTSGAPPPPFVDIRPQPAGPPSLVVPANVAGAAGGATYTGQGYVNSGILFTGQSFVLKIDAPPGTYEYLCLVHPTAMKATLRVTQ